MRYSHIHTYCGCYSPSTDEVLGKALLEKARSGRQPVRTTRVSVFVKRKNKALAALIEPHLRAQAKKVAAKVAAVYKPVQKAEPQKKTASIVEELLNAMERGASYEELLEVMAPALDDAYRQGMTVGVVQMGFDLKDVTNQMDKAAKAYIEKQGASLVKDLEDTTRDDLRALLGRAIEEGMSTNELSDAVEEMGAFGEGRADAIARTELATAHVQGNVQGWRESGEVEAKKWILGDNHDVPDICDEALEAGEIPMDDEFVDGVEFPPAHPNCVCDILPILKPVIDEGD